MRSLTGISITFNTHGENKNDSTIVHVFVKNRLGSSRTPEQHGDYISNRLDLSRYLPGGDLAEDQNPYLAYGEGLGVGTKFDDPSSNTFTLTPTSTAIVLDRIVLPAVSIHILTDSDDRWIFDYTLTFTVEDESGATSTIERSSVRDGLRGVILDQDNRDHYGILAEGFGAPPPRDVPDTDAVLSQITLDLFTHGSDDANKNADTRLNVHIANRLDATSAHDYAIGLNLFPGEEFFPGSSRRFRWSNTPGDGALEQGIRLAVVVLPVVYIVIVPTGDDRWNFDYRVQYVFTDPHSVTGKPLVFSSQTTGVILDGANPKHEGVYQGAPFPTVTPPTAPILTSGPVDHVTTPKMISIPSLQTKLDEFIKSRTGSLTDPNPPLVKLRLDYASRFTNETAPENYLDVQSLVPSVDLTSTPPKAWVAYVSSPRSLGQKEVADFPFRLQDINSSTMSVSLDHPFSVTPLTAKVTFETGGPPELASTALPDINFVTFGLTLLLTLDLDRTTDTSGKVRTLVDLMSWVAEIEQLRSSKKLTAVGPSFHWKGTFLHAPVERNSGVRPDEVDEVVTDFAERVIEVSLETDAAADPKRLIRRRIVRAIYDQLSSPDTFTGRTGRDRINAQVTSLLLGGIADDDENIDHNNTIIENIGIQNANPEFGIPEDSIVISYTGPNNVFVPRQPSNWPAGHDFTPGALAHIEHFVVLTMENRSFDHMLGYLSLPRASGGEGRTDVDGLSGQQTNPYQGTAFPTFALSDTIFHPGPPNGYESVHHAINGGWMDGFVKSYAEEHGDAVAGRIMGHHTAATVPCFDALARDFSIGHRWFAAHPGPTFPNRFYELTGRMNLDQRGFWEFDNSSPPRPVFTETIFDHLTGATDPVTGKPVTWTYFEHSYCTLRLFERYTFDHTNVVDINDHVHGFFTSAQNGQLPNVSFIDPHFVDVPPGSNCDEPPSDIAAGQKLVQRIVEAVIAGPAWDKTMLVIVYDEHGGFYDHVPPPAAARVSPDLPITTTYGLRVPAIVVSPWVRQGGVFGHDAGTGGHPSALVFDHTSILKTIVRRFLGANPPFLGDRFATASDLSAVMLNQPRQPQFRPFIPYNLQFAPSNLMLAVPPGNHAPGTPLVQSTKNGAAEQEFCFEDAGGGFVYLRSRADNLYLTAEAQGVGGASPTVFQDVKYGTGPGTPPQQSPELQRWQVTHVGLTTQSEHDHVVSNQAHPDLHLQPAGAGQNESPVVLGPPSGPQIGFHGGHTIWEITSPLLPPPGLLQ
jgi:phospholipase C